MRKSEFYGVSVPELGDRADITVVSQAIIDGEDNQSGKVENLKATSSGSTITLTSETRSGKLVKYYNGLAIQFTSPVNASAGTSYKIKIDNLAEQPFNNKVDIKVGDIVQAVYGSTGFVSANTPIPRSSSVASTSEVTVATSNAVKQAYDKGVEGLNKANAKLDAGGVSVDYNSGKKIEDKIKGLSNTKLDKTAIVNDLTTGGADKALSGGMGKKLDEDKQNKIDDELETDSKEIVGAINESLWRIIAKKINNNDDLNNYKTSGMFMSSSSSFNILNKPKDFRGDGALFLSVFALAPSVVKQVIYNYVNNQTFERRWNVDNWTEWAEVLNNDSKFFLGNTGINKVVYIQDAGTKTRGNGYIDKDTGKIYTCSPTDPKINSIKDTTVTSNFKLSSNVELSNRVDKYEPYKKLGTVSILNGGLDVSDYNEILVFCKVARTGKDVVNVFYLVKEYQGLVFNFYGTDLEGTFKYENNRIVLTNLGRNDDGAIDVLVR